MNSSNGFIIKADKVSISRAGTYLLNDISFELQKGDHLAITGPSGSGKTTLGLALAGKIFYKGTIEFAENKGNIVWVEQQHHFKTLSNTSDLYYQQRFNSYDSEETQTVKEYLGNSNKIEFILKKMQIEYLGNKPLIQLSNGENKKLQIAKALLLQPSVLIMDQPFVGLDNETRKYLHELISELAGQGTTMILIATADEMPGCITKIIALEQGQVKSIKERTEFLKDNDKRLASKTVIDKIKLKELSSASNPGFQNAICMKNVNVQYGEKKILQNISWEVKKGERWLLSGPNGAGKSTLLSLVTADNPQAYANEVYLFDKRRGSGESIWDIKKKIGFLSPELHVFFDQSCTVFETVASGLFDTIGLFRQLSQESTQLVYDWMEITGIKRLQQKRLAELSLGGQRIVLLARALVKNPPLLILDEPCQGIDSEKQSELLELINQVCLSGNKTMVFVTHYSEARPQCIDKFLKLEQGTVVNYQY